MSPLRILIIEDDPVSAAFFADALQDLGALQLAENGRQARECVSRAEFDLYLIDCRLPDGHALALLPALRKLAGSSVPALAFSAACDTGLETALLEAGFHALLPKPLEMAALRRAVRRTALSPHGEPPLWDDAQAMRALGDRPTHLAQLRHLLIGELPAQSRAIREAVSANDSHALRELLHRLKASCGFCGATALDAAARQLASHPSASTLQRFERACDALRADATHVPPSAPLADNSSSRPQDRKGRGPRC